jgi:hypothetical protein
MHIKYEYHGSNYGINANNYITYLVASFQRDSGPGTSNVDSAVLYGNNTTNVRIMKTATGVYELQARANVDNQAISLECTVLSEKESTVTPAPQGGVVAGSTTGTAYLAITSSNPIVNFEGQVRANEFRINSTQVIDSNGALQNVTYNGNTIWHAGSDGPSSGLSAQYVGGLEIGQTGSSYIPYVDGNGRVNIGTTGTPHKMHVVDTNSPRLVIEDSDNSVSAFLQADGTNGAYVGSYTNHVLRLATNNTTRVVIDTSGHMYPNNNDSQDLGGVNNVWRNIYTGDLHLNNESKVQGNDVDGTNGNWTIQEGAEDLYLINNKTGKKYKFNITEIE